MKIGNKVQVVTPKFVSRVGYPKELKDYLDYVNRFSMEISNLINDIYESYSGNKTFVNNQIRSKLQYEFAFALAKKDRFGGCNREIHWIVLPEYENRIATILSTRRVKTGIYHGGTGYGEDYDPPYLGSIKVHTLYTLDISYYLETTGDNFKVNDLETTKDNLRVIEDESW